MQAFLFYLAYPFLWLISKLPFGMLYAFSDFLFLLLYHVVGYRRKVTMDNLRNSFPEKSETELKAIAVKFYHHLCDITLETYKAMAMDKETMRERCTVEQQGDLARFHAEGKSILVVMGHYGNFEWACQAGNISSAYQLVVVYYKLKNEYFENFTKKLRTQFGTEVVRRRFAVRAMVANRHRTTATAIVADQTPAPEDAYWMTFLNQDTAVYWGTEKLAKRLNLPVFFCSVRRKKRGYYHMYYELLTDRPTELADGELTELHTRRLEEEIREAPAYWLWSHKRWKHSRPKVTTG